MVKNHSEQTRVVRIEKNTRGPVTGADVRTDDQVEVINKDHHIATLTDDVPFLLEMVVENGRGYVPAGEHTPQAQEIGMIPVDAAFSPVIRVRYEVEETRVGQKTNYDKLIMEIWTNGSVTPETGAGRVGQDSPQAPQSVRAVQRVGADGPCRGPRRGQPGARSGHRGEVEHEPGRTEPSVRATNCLESENITTVRDLVVRTEEPTAGSAKLRRDHAQRGPREAVRHRTAAGNAAAPHLPAGVTTLLVSHDKPRHNHFLLQAILPCDTEEKAASSAAIPIISVPCCAIWPAP